MKHVIYENEISYVKENGIATNYEHFKLEEGYNFVKSPEELQERIKQIDSSINEIFEEYKEESYHLNAEEDYLARLDFLRIDIVRFMLQHNGQKALIINEYEHIFQVTIRSILNISEKKIYANFFRGNSHTEYFYDDVVEPGCVLRIYNNTSDDIFTCRVIILDSINSLDYWDCSEKVNEFYEKVGYYELNKNELTIDEIEIEKMETWYLDDNGFVVFSSDIPL